MVEQQAMNPAVTNEHGEKVGGSEGTESESDGE